MEEFMKCIYMGKNYAHFLSDFFFSSFLFFLYQIGRGWFFFFFLFLISNLDPMFVFIYKKKSNYCVRIH